MSQINNLPKAINAFTPTPNQNAKQITALVKSQGKIVGYQLSNGTTLTKEEGVNLAKNGEIKGVAIALRNGTEYLRSLPDESENNNLSNLPTASMQS